MASTETSRVIDHAGSGLCASLIAALACYLALAAYFEGQYIVIAILAALPLLSIAAFLAIRILTWQPRYAEYACTLIIVLQSSTFRFRDIDDKSLDPQVALKLACICAMAAVGASGAWHLKFFARRLSDLVFWLMFLLYLMSTSLIAFNPVTSMVETSSNVLAFMFLFGIAGMLGPAVLIRILMQACVILCVMSIIFYVAVPSVGHMSDWVNRSFVITKRLQGVLGTPNSAGAAAAFGILITWLFPPVRRKSLIFVALNVPFLICLVGSNNRMAIAALGMAFAFYHLTHKTSVLKLSLFALGGALVVLLFAIWGDALLSSMARSGSADEILNGTGRTRIWAVVIDMWWDKPIFGYGAGSAKFILPHHPLLFKAAAHAHDMYLNILFASGAVGLAIFLASLVSSIVRMTAYRSMEVMSMLVFFLIYGITEPTIGGLTTFVSLSFFSIAVLSYSPRAMLRGTPDGKRRYPVARHVAEGFDSGGSPSKAHASPQTV